MQENNQFKAGIIFAFFSYLLWGVLPLYWNLLGDINAGSLLAHRIVWSFVTMLIVVLALGKFTGLIGAIRGLLQNKRALIGITAASFMVSINWLVFIWAVNSGHVLQSSLGYYINPLISILLAMIVLKEKSTKLQVVSFILAGIGVLYLTFSYGVFPWVSFVLAISFAFYGLLKKTVDVPPMFGLTIETLIVTPFAVIYLLFFGSSQSAAPIDLSTGALLFLSGGATALPLLLFASGAKRISLTLIGFIQYVAPTIMLILGVTLFNEVFTHAHLIAFTCIWGALVLYTASGIRTMRMRRKTAA